MATRMATVFVSNFIMAQGEVVSVNGDGTLTVRTGSARTVTGRAVTTFRELQLA